VPRPDLLYAQVVKQRERGQVVAVSSKIVFGDQHAVQRRLATSPASLTINTSFVERENVTLRQTNRRLRRKTNAYSKELAWLEKHLWLSVAYYHLVLPRELAQTGGGAGATAWDRLTAAVAVGHTRDGCRFDRSRLDDGRTAVLPGAGGISGYVATNRTFVSSARAYPSRLLRDSTRIQGCFEIRWLPPNMSFSLTPHPHIGCQYLLLDGGIQK
jgi:hypothetical protein